MPSGMPTMHTCPFRGCGKQFDRKYNLKCHQRIHSDEKPYRCTHAHCSRAFRWKSSLNHHLMSRDHTDPALRRARTSARVARPRRAPARQRRVVASAIASMCDTADDFGDHNASPNTSIQKQVTLPFADLQLTSGPLEARPLDYYTSSTHLLANYPRMPPTAQLFPFAPMQAHPAAAMLSNFTAAGGHASAVDGLPGSENSSENKLEPEILPLHEMQSEPVSDALDVILSGHLADSGNSLSMY